MMPDKLGALVAAHQERRRWSPAELRGALRRVGRTPAQAITWALALAALEPDELTDVHCLEIAIFLAGGIPLQSPTTTARWCRALVLAHLSTTAALVRDEDGAGLTFTDLVADFVAAPTKVEAFGVYLAVRATLESATRTGSVLVQHKRSSTLRPDGDGRLVEYEPWEHAVVDRLRNLLRGRPLPRLCAVLKRGRPCGRYFMPTKKRITFCSNRCHDRNKKQRSRAQAG
jgi:hypothetical protein